MVANNRPSPTPGDVTLQDAGFFTRWVWVYFSPRKAFSAVVGRPVWVAPLLIVLAVTAAGTWLTAPVANEYMKQRIEESDRVPEEMKQQMLESMDVASTSRMALRLAGSVVTAAVMLAVLGGFLLFLNNLVLGASARFSQTFAAACYLALVWVPSWALKAPLMLALGTPQVFFGPAALMPESEGTFLWTALTRLDVFGLWQVALACVALSSIGGYSVRRASAAVVPAWVVYSTLVAAMTWFGLRQFS